MSFAVNSEPANAELHHVKQPLLGTLMDGPLDIVGDVHGEIDALFQLMQRLGYNRNGAHPAHRRLVFVGDLCDRGPDSPAVVRLVLDLVQRGLAQCVLGNHEINLLRGSPKNGNGWFFKQDHDRERGRFLNSKPASDDDRAEFAAFFETLPLTLERNDLRIVHAAWLPSRVEEIAQRIKTSAQGVIALYRDYERQIETQFVADGLKVAAEREYREYGDKLTDPVQPLPLLPAIALEDELYQMSNPIRVLTSGVEGRAEIPFFASGKWRMVERVPWWEEYFDATPVVVGHYWRWVSEHARALLSKGEADLFANGGPSHWAGPKRNVYCVDYSVGGRYKERELGRNHHWETRLAALRWPEQELVFDEGEHVRLQRASP